MAGQVRAGAATRCVLSVAANENELERARLAAEERRLVEAAVTGSSEAFERLYRLHAGRGYG